MKKLKANQLGPWCSYCSPKTTRAIYRENGFANKFCCKKHVSEMQEYEHYKEVSQAYITEADEQTWKKF